MPGGQGVSALTLDSKGRVYALLPGTCVSPGSVHVLSNPPDYHDLKTIAVGICPVAASAVFPPVP
jgi:hypothetical protein